MSKNAKHFAQEMLKMSTNPQDRKEVVNACLWVLKTLSEDSSSIHEKHVRNIAGAGVTTPNSCYDVGRAGGC